MCRRSAKVLVSAALLAVVGGCEEGTGPAGSAISVVQSTLRDTVRAIHPFEIVVRNPSRQWPGRVEVRFQASSFDHGIYVERDNDSVFRYSIVDTTDAAGRVRVKTANGNIAGPTGLVITVPSLESVDTVPFIVDPGKPVIVRAAPVDTAVYANREFTLRPQATDQFGNPIANAVFQFSNVSGPVTVNAAGSVSTSAIGRAAVVVRAFGITDTAYVSVVPEAWVATQKFYAGNGGPEGIFLVQLDGSGRDSLTAGLINSFTPHGFGWSPDGQRLVLARGNTIYLLQPGGMEQSVVTMPWALNTAARFSRDGQWIYFAGGGGPGLYRVHADATGLEHIGDDTSHFGGDYFATPSHDGLSVAYSSTRGLCFNDPCIRVLDLATNQDRGYGTRDFLIHGTMAAWSPAEDLIAYGAGREVRLIRSTGVAAGVLATDAGTVKWMDWSPDGRWLIVAADFGVALFEINTGLRLPLAQFASYSATIWRP